MRQYRGLTKDGKWVYGWYCEVGGITYIIEEPTPMAMNQYGTYLAEEDFIEVIPETVGQQVGIQDKHGVEIYRDDKLSDDTFGASTVRWLRGEFYLWQHEKMKPLSITLAEAMEVIGNIHQNPELI